MYQIIVGGNIVALCDKLRYIKLKTKTGAYIEATEEEAQGVAVNSAAYNLHGHDEIKTVKINEETGISEKIAADVAIIKEVNDVFILSEQNARIKGNEIKTNEANETALTGLMATTDLYEELVEKGVL